VQASSEILRGVYPVFCYGAQNDNCIVLKNHPWAEKVVFAKL